MIITRKELERRGEAMYGKDRNMWEFKCSGCGTTQSANSIIEQTKKGIESRRYGLLKEGDAIRAECDCYGPECNWMANGLFNSGILMITDPAKPHDANLKKNCYYVFPFSKEWSE